MANLLQIGSSGVFGHQRMLNSTGNNIANVNTDGYSRQRTLNHSQLDDMGLARSTSGREVNKFAQTELLIDTSAASNSGKFLTEITRTDQVLSDESNDLSSGISKLFESFHTANDDPTSMSNRQLAISDAKSLVSSFHGVSAQLNTQMKTSNSEIADKPALLNSLLQEVHGFNKQIRLAETTAKGASASLYDQRDQSIKALAEQLDISTIVNDNKTISINLLSGQPLVMQDSISHFTAKPGNPDAKNSELVLHIDRNQFPLQSMDLGGDVGALFQFRDEVVRPALREIGQLGLGIFDAVNSQNKMGIDLNGEIGKDIYSVPTSMALGYRENSDSGNAIKVSLSPGQGSSLSNNEYQVTMTSPVSFDIYEIKDGVVGDTPLNLNGSYPGPVQIEPHGFELDFSAAPSGFKSGDKFLVTPTIFNLEDFDILMSQPEEIAMASVLRTSRDNSNVTDSKLLVSHISDPSLSFSHNDLNLSAPQHISVNGNGDYDIFDGHGTLLATSSGATLGDDLFVNAIPPLNPGVGYDVHIDGRPNPGESFSLQYNRQAIGDNSNGLLLAGLENADKLRKNDKNNGENQMTFAEGISNLISGVGNKTRAARVDSMALDAKLVQSQNWVQSVSGVNLDEEAANMVRFEQAYNASAKVVSVSKEIFDTILNAAR